MEGSIYISGGVTYDTQGNPIGHPIAIRATKRQEADPEGYELSRNEFKKEVKNLTEIPICTELTI